MGQILSCGPWASGRRHALDDEGDDLPYGPRPVSGTASHSPGRARASMDSDMTFGRSSVHFVTGGSPASASPSSRSSASGFSPRAAPASTSGAINPLVTDASGCARPATPTYSIFCDFPPAQADEPGHAREDALADSDAIRSVSVGAKTFDIDYLRALTAWATDAPVGERLLRRDCAVAILCMGEKDVLLMAQARFVAARNARNARALRRYLDDRPAAPKLAVLARRPWGYRLVSLPRITKDDLSWPPIRTLERARAVLALVDPGWSTRSSGMAASGMLDCARSAFPEPLSPTGGNLPPLPPSSHRWVTRRQLLDTPEYDETAERLLAEVGSDGLDGVLYAAAPIG